MGLAGAAGAVAGGAALFNLFKKNKSDTEIQQPSSTTAGILDTIETVENTETDLNDGKVILVQRTKDQAYAYWEIPAERKAEFIRLGGRKQGLRLYDVTDVTDINLNELQPVEQYECDQDNDLHIRIPACDRDYIAQLGYIRSDGSWLNFKASEPVRISSLAPVLDTESDNTLPVVDTLESPSNIISTTTITPATSHPETTNGSNGHKSAFSWFDRAAKIGSAVAGAGAVAVGSVTKAFDTNGNKEAKENKVSFQNNNRRSSLAAKTCQIILVPRSAEDAYAYWEVSSDYKQAARDQGGIRFVLRVHDSTNLDIDYQQPHSTQEYVCDENQFDKHVNIPISNRDYIAEVGYYTSDNRWIRVIRSFHVRVPAN
jgi:hypothetical protein